MAIIKDAGYDQWAISDDAGNGVLYLGYPNFNQTGSDPKCAILKVETSGQITTRKWSNGSSDRNVNWSDRTSVSYDYLK